MERFGGPKARRGLSRFSKGRRRSANSSSFPNAKESSLYELVSAAERQSQLASLTDFFNQPTLTPSSPAHRLRSASLSFSNEPPALIVPPRAPEIASKPPLPPQSAPQFNRKVSTCGNPISSSVLVEYLASVSSIIFLSTVRNISAGRSYLSWKIP